ncbi:kinase-like protein [Ramaria rubella]|nr:kinase-like protein [Ramaria rubella]
MRGGTSTGHNSAVHLSGLPPLTRKSSGLPKKLEAKGQRVTLTSKHNWWLIDVEEDDEPVPTTPVKPVNSVDRLPVDVSPPQFHAPLHPSSIFAHPTPTSSFVPPAPSFPFPAPQNPTARLAPIATGSTSELFKCIVKKPDIVQMEINGEMQTNAPDVMAQFLAELRVYSTLAGHRNFPAYLGSLDGVGMVLEFIEGRSLLDVLESSRPSGGLDRRTKVSMHNQLLEGLTYLHSFGLSHGDLSLLNVLVTRNNTLKILDFGRSTSITSKFASPSEPPPEPDMSIFAPPPRPALSRATSQALSIPDHRHTITLQLDRSSTPSPPTTPRLTPPKIEQIHSGTRPFTAPEILREECTDPILADAYSFAMILHCVDLGGLVDVDINSQIRGIIPDLSDCDVFGERLRPYLADVHERKRLSKDDLIDP